MSKTRTVIKGGGLMAVATVIAAVSLVIFIGHRRETKLEQWIGGHIVSVVGRYLQPQLSFESLDYRAPYTVTVKGLAFRSEGETLISGDSASVRLTESPRFQGSTSLCG